MSLPALSFHLGQETHNPPTSEFASAARVPFPFFCIREVVSREDSPLTFLSFQVGQVGLRSRTQVRYSLVFPLTVFPSLGRSLFPIISRFPFQFLARKIFCIGSHSAPARLSLRPLDESARLSGSDLPPSAFFFPGSETSSPSLGNPLGVRSGALLSLSAMPSSSFGSLRSSAGNSQDCFRLDFLSPPPVRSAFSSSAGFR